MWSNLDKESTTKCCKHLKTTNKKVNIAIVRQTGCCTAKVDVLMNKKLIDMPSVNIFALFLNMSSLCSGCALPFAAKQGTIVQEEGKEGLCLIIHWHVSSQSQSPNYIHKENALEMYPTLSRAMRLLPTLRVTVASGVRWFFSSKLIKSYLRLTMSQDRLPSLAVLSTEHEVTGC